MMASRGLIGLAYGMGPAPDDAGIAGIGLDHWLATARQDYGIADESGGRGPMPRQDSMYRPLAASATAVAPAGLADDGGGAMGDGGSGDASAERPYRQIRPAEAPVDDPAPQLRISETMPGSPQASWKMGQPPRLFREADRRQSILSGTPGSIVVEPNPDADGRKPLVERPAQEHVREHEALMDRIAARYGVDPNLVKAIAYMETTHGWYDSFRRAVGQEKSVRPMNIHAQAWSGLGYSRNDLDDPEKNIEAGVRIIKGISERAENPSVRNVATLYNSLASDKVNDYGARVEQIYQEKPWLKP